ncbi:unnamed protein product, partial [Gadus morhua 'NCC']
LNCFFIFPTSVHDSVPSPPLALLNISSLVRPSGGSREAVNPPASFTWSRAWEPAWLYTVRLIEDLSKRLACLETDTDRVSR